MASARRSTSWAAARSTPTADPAHELLRHAGMAWLRDLAWPVGSAILDGEAVAGDGNEGIHSVFVERGKAGGAMAVVLFDVLQLDGRNEAVGVPDRHGRTALVAWPRGHRLAVGQPSAAGSMSLPVAAPIYGCR
jgi:hypothetical protein